MPFLLEHITEGVMWMMVGILVSSCGLIAITVLRRRQRQIYFQRVDDLRERFSPLIAQGYNGKKNYEQVREALEGIRGPDRVHALELLLLAKKPLPAQLPVLRRLCEDLGLVEVWQRQLREWAVEERAGGNRSVNLPRFSYLIRAAAAEKLGLIRHAPSWARLAEALNDAHPDVVAVAARALASIGEPLSFSALVDRLRRVVLDPANQVSLRTLKMALVTFHLDLAPELLPSLRDPVSRIRFVATDILREMTERAAASADNFILDDRIIPRELAQLLWERLSQDGCPDVRARAAPILAYMESTQARSALFALLEDPEWFVRLHAVRAMAKRRFAEHAQLIAPRLTDTQWMVREAAARTMLTFGRPGLELVYAHVLSTRDRYSKEQVADDLQRAGLIPALLSQYGKDGEGKEAMVLEAFADLGKTSCMLAALTGSADHLLRQKFLRAFGRHPDPQIRTWVRDMAARDFDARRTRKTTGQRNAA